MTRALYLDCEFNGDGGSFISIALFDPFDNLEFYEVSRFWLDLIKYHEDAGGMKNWVKENVVPMFGKKAIMEHEIKAKLVNFLSQFVDDIVIYADWPEDFIHLLKLLYAVNPNNQIPSKLVAKLKMELITTGDGHVSKLPHNALEDAKALYLNHMEMLKNVPAN